MAETQAHKDWTKANTKVISMRLNVRTDADIIEYLADKPVQTEIKRLLRQAIANQKPI